MSEKFTLRAAVYLILITDSQILLSKRYNTGWQDGNYSLISGHLEGGETIAKCMSREAFEESGLIIKEENLKVVQVMHRQSDFDYIDFYLTTDKWKGKAINKEPHKCDDLDWFELTNLPDNLIPNVKKALELFKKGVYFSEFGF